VEKTVKKYTEQII